MIKFSLKPSRLYTSNPCTVIWSGNGRKQLRSSKRSFPNSVSQRSCTSASLSSKEKHPSMMKAQSQLATMRISALTPSKYTSSTPMVVSLWKTEKRILGHLHKKEVRGPSSTGQTSTIRDGVCQAKAAVEAETHAHKSFHTVCTMAVTPTTAQKIAPYSLSPKERWSKTPSSLRNNHHPEK
jgi:hypothetical protein